MGRSSTGRSTTMVRGNRHDRLSNLPDDILLAVLDRLNARDAARASVVSRRWIRLPAMLSRLRVSVHDFLPHKGPVFSADEVARSNAAVVEATRSILARREDSAIDTTIRLLSVTFFLKGGDPVSIGRAVARTMATHEVELAEFTVMTEDTARCYDDDTASSGRQFASFFDACPGSFRRLTRLHLENLRFGDGESGVADVLVACERLKDLRLSHCDAGDATTLQVDHAQLTDLGIVDCIFSNVVLNWVPRLTRLAYEGWIYYDYPLTVGYAPLLEAVDLSNVGTSNHETVELSKFFRGTTSVRDLKLGFKSERIWVQPECLTKSLASVFRQLRFLNLDDIPEGYDLTWTLFILRAAPLLKELYMTVWDHRCKMVTDAEKRKELSFSDDKGAAQWEESSDGFRHDGLATLVMFGFQYEEYMVGYLRRVMAAAVNLKDVFLYDRHSLACGTCPRKRVKFPGSRRQRSWLKKRIADGFDSFPVIHFPTDGGIRADHLAKHKYP